MLQDKNKKVVALALGICGLLVLALSLSYADKVMTLSFNRDLESPYAVSDTGSFSGLASLKYGTASLLDQFKGAFGGILERATFSKSVQINSR